MCLFHRVDGIRDDATVGAGHSTITVRIDDNVGSVAVLVAAVAGGALASAAGSQTLFIVAGCVGLAACVWAWAVGLGSLRVDDVVEER